MFPELFTIPGTSITVHSFGLLLVIGVLAAIQLAKRLARSRGLDGELFVNLGIIALLSGLVGARLSHVLENLPTYTDRERSAFDNLWAAANITSGGLTYYGGFLLAFPVTAIYVIRKKIPFRTCMDIIAPVLMVGLAFGRIGCFLNGCCYGAQAELPWSVRFPFGSIAQVDQFNAGQMSLPPELEFVATNGVTYPIPAGQAFRNPLTRPLALQCSSLPVHPAQLYSAAVAFLLAGMTVAFYYLPGSLRTPGRGMALMLMLEGVARFLLESVRAEPAVVRYTLGAETFGLSYSMVLGLGISGVGVALWLVLGVLSDKSEQFPELPGGRSDAGAVA